MSDKQENLKLSKCQAKYQTSKCTKCGNISKSVTFSYIETSASVAQLVSGSMHYGEMASWQMHFH